MRGAWGLMGLVGCMPSEGDWATVEPWIEPIADVTSPPEDVQALLDAIDREDPEVVDRTIAWLQTEPILPRDQPCTLARAIEGTEQSWPTVPVWAYRIGRRLTASGFPELSLRVARHMTDHADERVNWSLGMVVLLEAQRAGASDGRAAPGSEALFDVMVREAWCMDQTSVALVAEQSERWSVARAVGFAQRQRRWQRQETARALVAMHPVRDDIDAMSEVAASINAAQAERGRTRYGLFSDFFLLGFEDAAALVDGRLPADLPP